MNEMKCYVAADLLPLYLDKACGPETARDLEAHLETCPRCRALKEEMEAALPTPAGPDAGARRFGRVCRTLLGNMLALAVVIACFGINLGPAVWGSRAMAGNLVVTILYAVLWGVFFALSRNYRPQMILSFTMSILTFLSSAMSLVCILTGKGGFIAGFLSAPSSVPFFGLRAFLSWRGLYAVTAVISAIWLAASWFRLRRLKVA